jgi:hypothetical protein
MFYALMRPAEVARLIRTGCYLPVTGWGRLTLGDSAPAPGKEWTNTGDVHQDRGLKGRSRQIRTESTDLAGNRVPDQRGT